MVMKVGQWMEARAAVSRMGSRGLIAMRQANKHEAQLFRSLVVRAFNSRGRSNGKAWDKLKPATIKRKGSSKPLIDRGDLRNSIAVIDQGDEIFVGVSSKTRSRSGGPLANIAEVHELGKIIVQKRGQKVVVIKIPKRSFLKATADFHFKPADTKARFLARVAIMMGRGWAVQAPMKAGELAKAGVAASKPTPIPSKPARARDAGGRFT